MGNETIKARVICIRMCQLIEELLMNPEELASHLNSRCPVHSFSFENPKSAQRTPSPEDLRSVFRTPLDCLVEDLDSIKQILMKLPSFDLRSRLSSSSDDEITKYDASNVIWRILGKKGLKPLPVLKMNQKKAMEIPPASYWGVGDDIPVAGEVLSAAFGTLSDLSRILVFLSVECAPMFSALCALRPEAMLAIRCAAIAIRILEIMLEYLKSDKPSWETRIVDPGSRVLTGFWPDLAAGNISSEVQTMSYIRNFIPTGLCEAITVERG